MLGVNFDFWPPEKSKWSTCGVLTSRLDDAHLLPLVGRLRGSLLRIGGSPADFMLYDVFPGACSQANLNKTQPDAKTFQPTKYFCPIWDQVRGQCLTMPRWRAINQFAMTTGLRIAFDLNGCWGRKNATSEMDMTMISGLFNVTAQMAASGTSAVYAFQFTNEVYSHIEAGRYGSDLLKLRRLLDAAWADHGASAPPTLMGPDNGWTDMSAAHLDGILNVSASVMAAVTYHDYMDPCIDKWPEQGLALNATCLDNALDGAMKRYGAVVRRHGKPLWLGEAGLHANSGIDGLTNVFTSSLFYAHALGRLARNGVGLMSRQTLLGGDYELINRTSGLPNPDYFVALLWHDLVGAEVMGVSLLGGECGKPHSDCAKALRVHAHSAYGEEESEEEEGGASTVVLVMINFALETAFDLALSTSTTSGGSSRVDGGQLWQLTGQPASNRIFLNGKPLEVDVPGKLPPMHAAPCDPSKITLPPSSVTFCCLGCRRSVL